MLGRKSIIIIITSLITAVIVSFSYALPSLYKTDEIGGNLGKKVSKSKVKANFKDKKLKERLKIPKKGLKSKKDVDTFSKELKTLKDKKKCKSFKVSFKKGETMEKDLINKLTSLIEGGKCE